MEDRYLFKAKKKNWQELPKDEQWVTGTIMYIENKCMMLIEDEDNLLRVHYLANEMWSADIYAIEVDESTICRCTGLKDKNGKLIWESDIIKDLFSDVCAQIKYGSYQSCFDSTKTEHVGFYVDWSGKYTKRYRKDLGYWINMVDAEVVGNAFDNPELCWERNNNGKNY